MNYETWMIPLIATILIFAMHHAWCQTGEHIRDKIYNTINFIMVLVMVAAVWMVYWIL